MKKLLFLFFAVTLIASNTFAQYTKLFDFNGAATGRQPNGSLISDGTFLYGMTAAGGTGTSCGFCGTIFKIMPDGTGYFKMLDFAGATNGNSPAGSFISDSIFLYGTTSQGGANNLGTIFKIKPDGTGYAKLHDCDSVNGSSPFGSLFSDGTFLYGMTQQGGAHNDGAIFKIKPDGTSYIKLLDFSGVANGQYPTGSLISDGTYFYGTTNKGGTGTCPNGGCGTIFKIKHDGTGYVKLLDFAGTTNGSNPNGDLISVGTFLYGTTVNGGANNFGTIFKIKTDGTGYVKLLDFASFANGQYPTGSLISDGTFLYGISDQGGANNFGTIFKIKPDGTGFAKLVDFAGATTGSHPYGSLISDGNFLYGMAGDGGNSNDGVIFKLAFTTGIAVNNMTIGIDIYPNPFNSQTTINFNEEQKNITVKIMDVIGKEIKSINFTGKQLIIEKGEMPAGTYFLYIKTEQGRVVQKLIINQ